MSAPVVDFHVHLAHYEQYQPSAVAWMEGMRGESMEAVIARYSDPQHMATMLREAGVDYACLLAELSPVTTGTCSNELVAEFCRPVPWFLPVASINPYLMLRPARELERYVREMGFRALKLYPTYQYYYPNDRMLYPVYARCEELGIPVMIHTGSSVFKGARLKYGDPLYLDDVANDFPDLPLLLVHGGRGFWYDRAFFLARLHPNVYVEIAGLPPGRLLDYFPELERIADKVIFGSDWPGVNIKENIAQVRALPLGEHAKEQILGGNAARLLGLPIA